MSVLLIGAGPMALEYVSILKDVNREFKVIGRGEESASLFEEKTGVKVVRGGLNNWLKSEGDVSEYSHAIVASTEKNIGLMTISLIQKGIKNILVEKPGGFDHKGICDINELSKEHSANVFVGYNRRFYCSVEECQKIIEKDGGVTSFNFEFTEWGHVIKDLQKEDGVLENWFMHNSSHVIDMAFFLGGWPNEISTYISGGKDSWHPSGTVFSGSGVSSNGAIFSYQANWEAPGRWGVEILTKKHKLILKPLEKLQIQNIGSITTEFVEIDDKIDTEYKAGLYKQTVAFVNNENDSRLCTIDEQCKHLKIYSEICAE